MVTVSGVLSICNSLAVRGKDETAPQRSGLSWPAMSGGESRRDLLFSGFGHYLTFDASVTFSIVYVH